MNYYQCPLTELYQEVLRRKHIRPGCRDQLCESLWRDDDVREANATTVSTERIPEPSLQGSTQTTSFGQTAEPNLLINERA